MERGRSAVLVGARRVFAEVGVRRASMTDIAVRAGMAKATLYNHVRTKDEIIAALVIADFDEMLREAREVSAEPPKALARIAWRCSRHPVLRGALRAEPTLAAEALASMATHPVWSQVRAHTAALLDDLGLLAQEEAVDLVLRWWVSLALAPDDVTPERLLLPSATRLVDGLRPRS